MLWCVRVCVCDLCNLQNPTVVYSLNCISFRFPEFPAQFPYKAKAMFVFQECDGVDICIFGMHVQEYGSECPHPNSRYSL